MARAECLADLADGRFAKEPKKFSLDSRLAVVHYLYNVMGLGEADKSGPIPSVDANALSAMAHPFAAGLRQWRSASRKVGALRGALGYSFDDGEGGKRVFLGLSSMGYGDGEQIIASRKECLPLSLGKEGKEAVVAPPGMVWVGFEWRDADLRVFAWLSKSESLREALAGGDFYGRLAQRMLVTDCLGPDFALSLLPRIVGLSLYNGLAHGLTGWAVSREFKGLTVHKAATLSESLWERDFPDFVKWMEASCREWGKGDAVVGYALGGSKRVRKVEGVTRERYVREALEVCGRGSVGILLKKVLAELAGLAIGDLVKATLPGYDSVYFLVPEGERDRFIREVGPLASVEIGDSLRMRPIWKSGTSWGNVEPLGADIVGEF